MSSRLWGIIAKEFIQLWRDRLALTLALFVPVAMLFIFGWAINTDVKHVPTAVFDQSGGVEARTLLEAFTNSQYFDIVQQARSHRELTRLIDGGAAKVGIVIPPDFGRQLTRQNVSVQVIVDASDPQVATSAMNAAAAIGAQRSLEILTQTVEGTVLRRGGAPVDVRVRAWYNPDLVSAIFIVPGLIGALLMQTTVSVMAITVVREREKGTLEALVVSPIRRWELLLGKIVPNLLVAYGQMTMALIVAHVVFDVPIRGSLPLLYGLSAIFMFGTLGIGIFVSAASHRPAGDAALVSHVPALDLSLRPALSHRGHASGGSGSRERDSSDVLSTRGAGHRAEGDRARILVVPGAAAPGLRRRRLHALHPPLPQAARVIVMSGLEHLSGAALRREQERTLAAPRMRDSLLARVLFRGMDLVYGRRRTLSKFKVLELIARVPYQAWDRRRTWR